MKINLTVGEIDALLQTAGQMRDDLSYYDFLSKAKFKKFTDDYESAMGKLREKYQSRKSKKKIR